MLLLDQAISESISNRLKNKELKVRLSGNYSPRDVLRYLEGTWDNLHHKDGEFWATDEFGFVQWVIQIND